MIFERIRAAVLAVVAFFGVLFAGYIRYYPHNRIFLDRYYTDAHNKRQTFDLVIPKSASGSTGLILCIHGGGWVEGSKASYTETLMQLSERNGFAAAAINYRYVCETVCFDDILDDVTSALAAIRKTGVAYGVDFDKAMLTGTSAGGHISLLYAYTRQDEAPVRPVCVAELCGPTDLENEFYYSDENSISQAVGAAYFRGIIGHGAGVGIDPDNFDAARPALYKYSPIHYINASTVPTLFGHGEQDTIVPYQNALDLDAALTACGVEHTFVSFPNSGHACEDETEQAEFMALFLEYADKYLKS